MDLIPGHKFRVAIAEQTAEGAVAAAPEFIIPCYDGDLGPRESRADHEATDSLRHRRGEYKQRFDAGGSLQLASFPDSIGRLINGPLGSDTVTGAGDPRTHTMIPSDNRSWHTIWMERPRSGGLSQWDRFEDVLIPMCRLEAGAGGLLRTVIGCEGKTMKPDVAAPAGGVENKLDSAGPWYVFHQAVLKLELDTTPAVAQLRNISSFSIPFGYQDLSLEQTDELTPRFADPGLFTIGFSADILLQDYAAYKATFFGGKAVSDVYPSAVIVTGSLDFLLNVGPVVNALRTLQIQEPAVNFTLTPPGPDPSGKGLRATLTGKLQAPAAGEPFTAILKNAQAAAY